MMSRKKRRKVGSRLKHQILQESLVPGCVVTELAWRHKISPKTVYGWRREYFQIRAASSNITEGASKFVEVKVESDSSSSLEKASLIFKDYSLIMEGRISSKQLISIFKILEEEQC
jgi:transposase-like protein